MTECLSPKTSVPFDSALSFASVPVPCIYTSDTFNLHSRIVKAFSVRQTPSPGDQEMLVVRITGCTCPQFKAPCVKQRHLLYHPKHDASPMLIPQEWKREMRVVEIALSPLKPDTFATHSESTAQHCLKYPRFESAPVPEQQLTSRQ